MSDLLNKTHRILEKGVMEFRPFGQDTKGEKIRDVSGMTVRADVEYLKEIITRTQGREAGDSALQDLTRLLNDRIPDPAFHVTPEFLQNPWNSYSYEFVMYLAEFCAELSGDSDFHLNLGREKFLSPIIQVLGRPFTIVQIYRLYPYFVEKFTKGALRPKVLSVTNGAAVMRLEISENTTINKSWGWSADHVCLLNRSLKGLEEGPASSGEGPGWLGHGTPGNRVFS